MAKIDVEITLEEFRIVHKNEGTEEPFIIPLFFRIDSRSLVPAGSETVRVETTRAEHGNLGAASKGMSGNELSLDIPTATGRWRTSLEIDLSTGITGTALAINDSLRRAACRVMVLVAFAEEESTSNAAARHIAQAVLTAIRQIANEKLRKAVAEAGGVNVTLSADEYARIENTAVRVAFEYLPTVLDSDEILGYDHEAFTFDGLIRAGRRGRTFELSGGNRDRGQYRITGSARRVDVDELPVIAAVGRGPSLTVYARSPEDTLVAHRSADGGRTIDSSKRFQAHGVFTSGPGACATADSAVSAVFGRGTDNTIWMARTTTGDLGWQAWSQVDSTSFVSAPSAAITADGKTVHLVGRRSNDGCFHNVSRDSGTTWRGWRRIGQGIIRSTPAVAVTPDGGYLLVSALGSDDGLWYAISRSAGAGWDVAWKRITLPQRGLAMPMGIKATDYFTSAPAATIADTANSVIVGARAFDNSFWAAITTPQSDNFAGFWYKIGGEMASAPALVAKSDGRLAVFGLDRNLHLCAGELNFPHDTSVKFQRAEDLFFTY